MSDDDAPESEKPAEQPQGRGAAQRGGGAQTFQGLANLRQAMAVARPTPTAAVPATMAAVPVDVQPKRDEFGRSYATGKRKNAVARVWIKPGNGKIEVNGRDSPRISRAPCCACCSTSRLSSPTGSASSTSGAPSRAADCQARPGRCGTASAGR